MSSFRSIAVILVVSLSCTTSVQGWTNEEFEMFDLVEELGSVTLYEFLGVSKEASTREIKSAYRQLSVKLHPDKNPDDPTADVKFRQLVGAYEALKDDELRKSYHNVLEFGLPSWRQPVFYFRRARRLAIWQVCILLLIIVTTGQYLAAWGSYFEKKLSLNQYAESSLKKARKLKKAQKDGTKIEDVQADLVEQFLQKPSMYNTAPFQLVRFGKYLIVQFPFDIVKFVGHIQEERRKEQERLIQKKLEEEENDIPPEPKKPRKRKTFQAPEKEFKDDDGESTKTAGSYSTASTKPQEIFVSGGLWTDDDISQLIKLCTKYPGGFPDRWNQISMIMRRPVGEVVHMAKKVLEGLNNKSAEEEEESVKVKVKTKGSKFDDADMLEKVQAWSKEDQKRLEAALQMYPKSTVGDRWMKIASHVGKSKDECMQRYKYVADLVKKKKEQCDVEAINNQITESNSSPVTTTEDDNGAPKDTTTESTLPQKRVCIDLTSNPTVSRQSSTSSSYGSSGSDNDWCVVDEKIDSQRN